MGNPTGWFCRFFESECLGHQATGDQATGATSDLPRKNSHAKKQAQLSEEEEARDLGATEAPSEKVSLDGHIERWRPDKDMAVSQKGVTNKKPLGKEKISTKPVVFKGFLVDP